jgi:DNA repair photolyase
MINESKGNMYEFITHTWNTIKGECFHGCSYCYMKRWGKQRPVRFDEKELKTDLGKGNFIFVGSSCDMWAKNIPEDWILSTLRKCYDHNTNSYLFQTKNPARFLEFQHFVFYQSVFCTTLETNRDYPVIMQHSPSPGERIEAMIRVAKARPTFLTIEPIMSFDHSAFVEMIEVCRPKQVNIGADTGKNNLPEPTKEQIQRLIEDLSGFTIVHQKPNLKRLLK